ncbi:MAG: DegT/DnrJ/EryC1/StrS family aminotransferase [bacterium]|nr:DegT/DnrJ/EryC1/StrS family aminotransferase [bacterium]
MTKFNSLGSNYTFSQAWQALTIREQKDSDLAGFFNCENDQLEFFYKGREALRAALRCLNLPAGSRVAITGFTCLAVYEAVLWEGLEPVVLDIDETLNLNFADLKNQPSVQAVIVQNTFGFPYREIEVLEKWTKENKVYLVEDNAHAFGATYTDGRKVGTVGQVAIFSASQDKILDSVAGGILVINDHNLLSNLAVEKIATPKMQQKRDRWYPLLTWTIRKTYDFGLGKVLHAWFKRQKWLSQPMHYQTEKRFQILPTWQIQLLGARMKLTKVEQKQRQKKVRLYLQLLNDDLLFWRPSDEEISRSACLRLPVKVPAEKRAQILQTLAAAGYQLRDFWYDAPVGPKKYWQAAGYQANFSQLKNASLVCASVINLPTHQDINEHDVRKICQVINQT